MNIYTRNGDFGTTSDIHGQSLSKSHTKIVLQGSIDEVNSGLGYLRALIEERVSRLETQEKKEKDMATLTQLSKDLKAIQRKLFEMGTDISSDFDTNSFTEGDVKNLETAIDQSLEVTGELHHFIYLSGSVPGAWCHTLRSITRRAEREFVAHLENLQPEVIPHSYKYINRLADYFFQVARHINHLDSQEELV